MVTRRGQQEQIIYWHRARRFLNSISNAIKFTSELGDTPFIKGLIEKHGINTLLTESLKKAKLNQLMVKLGLSLGRLFY